MLELAKTPGVAQPWARRRWPGSRNCWSGSQIHASQPNDYACTTQFLAMNRFCLTAFFAVALATPQYTLAEETHWSFRCSNALKFEIDLPETVSADGNTIPGQPARFKIKGQTHTLFHVPGASADNWIGTSGYSVHLGNRNGNRIAFKEVAIGERCVGTSVTTWR